MSARPARDGKPRRALLAVLLVGLIALVFLLLGHRWLENWTDELRGRTAQKDLQPRAAGGVSGVVTRADGSPAAAARVRIGWRDSAGRPGSTPTVADANGKFSEADIPPSAQVTEIRASSGPLAATLREDGIRREGSGVRAEVKLPGEFRVAGLVRRSGDRTPVAGATLELGGVKATTSESGKFELDHVPASALGAAGGVVTITADGIRPLTWPVPPDDLPETYGDVTILVEAAR
jgi:hypothetical protein